MTSERELILNAVNAGNYSLPQIRTATGLEYARLYPLLESLTPWEISKTETADGFDRFYPLGAEPDAEFTTKPFCIKCRRVCFFMTPIAITANASGKWSCPKCRTAFRASHLAHSIKKPKTVSPNGDKPKEPTMSYLHSDDDRGEADRVLADMRERDKHPSVQLGNDEERALAAMRDEDEGSAEDSPVDETLCGCGRSAKHVGRCAFRRERTATKNEHSEPTDIPASNIPSNNITKDRVPASPSTVIEPQNETTANKTSGVSLDGGLRFNITLDISADELATWSPIKISDFFKGLATIVAARK